MDKGFQFRDVFNPAVVTELAGNIARVWPQFTADDFTAAINPRLAQLSFGERNALIRDSLYHFLPPDFLQAVQILLDALGPQLDQPELTGFDGFIIMPQCDFVAAYGLEYFDISMHALYEMTKRFSAEGAIRPFIGRYPQETLARLEVWSRDENPHVRRLVSEGTRPRLPLAPRLQIFVDDPRPVLRLLENLKTDPELYVRRSVANNLNDIAKDNPKLVIETLQRWQGIENEGTQWLIRHASRTLLKQGNSAALALLGYPPEVAVRVEDFSITTPQVQFGDNLNFTVTLAVTATESQRLMIDYVIHHVKANGQRAPKVFKWSKKTLKPGQVINLQRSHPIKPISTRKYYGGQHLLQVQVNGQIVAESPFDLVMSQ